MASRRYNDLDEDATPFNGPNMKPPFFMEDRRPDGSYRRVLVGDPETSTIQIGNSNVMYAGSGKKKSKIPRKKPITTSTDEPTRDQMDYIANNIGVLWRKLGRKLRLSDGQLDNFKMQYSAEGQCEVVYQMLRQWKSQYHPVTLQKLAKACDDVGRGDLSDDLSSSSTAEPTQDQMKYIADNIGSKWGQLGHELGLSDGQLDNLKIEYRTEGRCEVVYQMLLKWKSQSDCFTLQKLAEACDAVGQGDLSDYLS